MVYAIDVTTVLLGIGAVLAGVAGVLTAYAGIIAAKHYADEECEEKVHALRIEVEVQEEELHRFRMREADGDL